MKTKLLFGLFFLAMSLSGFSTTWTINNSGTTFTPNSITINLGDDVNFVIGGAHQAREVSQTSWNANDNTPLAGGFQTAFGGGLVAASQLTVGTHWYVCTPHAAFGMKGVIIVQDPLHTSDNFLTEKLSIYPNPSNGQFNFTIDETQISENCQMEIYNIQGVKVFQTKVTKATNEMDVSNLMKGVYFLTINDEKYFLSKKIVIQ